MSDRITHECGVALVRLRKPLRLREGRFDALLKPIQFRLCAGQRRVGTQPCVERHRTHAGRVVATLTGCDQRPQLSAARLFEYTMFVVR